MHRDKISDQLDRNEEILGRVMQLEMAKSLGHYIGLLPFC